MVMGDVSVWNHCAVGVWAVPSWKVFTFGGHMGELSSNPRGSFDNAVGVFDTSTYTWVRPECAGKPPACVSNAAALFDKEAMSLMIVGGYGASWNWNSTACNSSHQDDCRITSFQYGKIAIGLT
jgi:hypothetical protein